MSHHCLVFMAPSLKVDDSLKSKLWPYLIIPPCAVGALRKPVPFVFQVHRVKLLEDEIINFIRGLLMQKSLEDIISKNYMKCIHYSGLSVHAASGARAVKYFASKD